MSKEKYILFIDDEEHILTALIRSLRKWLNEVGLSPLTAKSAHDGMNQIISYGNDIAVIISDQRMPDIKGSDLTKIVGKKYPDTTIIILSGHSTMEDMADIIGSHVFSFIQKPWEKEELQAEICKGYEMFKLKRENRKHREKQRKDLRMAGEFQKAFLHTEPPIGEKISFNSTYLPFSENGVSGDYYDFYELPHNRYVVLIGDVADKGMKAALVTPVIKSMVYEDYIIHRENHPFSPGLFLKWLNNRICYFLSKNPELYISFSAAFIDLNRNVVITANAGHPPIFLIHEGRVITSNSEGMVLGYKEDQEYQETIHDLHSEETLVMLTDGLFPHERDREFSKTKLIDILKDAPDPEDHKALLDAILKASEMETWNDDVTLLTLKIL